MHGRHSGKLVDKFSAHPYALCIIVAHCIEKAEFGRQEARRHAGVYDEGQEGAEIGEGESAAGNGKCIEGGCHIVVPTDEAVSG